MSGSLQIGRLFGIPVRVHWLFLGLVAFIALLGYQRGGLLQGVHSALFIIALFACVVVHELSHSLVARRYGVKVESITLLPIGGVAAMEEMPRKPMQELTMAIAGPLASLAIGAGLWFVWRAMRGAESLQALLQFSPLGTDFVRDLMWVNVMLAGFNILPAFPMDGGRVLRAVLASQMSYVQATRIAAMVGRVFAVLMGLVAFAVGHVFLVVIALFIFLGASAEERQVRIHAMLENVPVAHAMIPRFETIAPEYPVGAALQYASQGYQHDFPVVEGEHIIGVVTRQGLIEGLSSHGGGTPVRDVMRTDMCQAAPQESLADVYVRMAKGACPVALVVEQARVVGLITPESVQNYLAAAVHRAADGAYYSGRPSGPDILG